MKGNDAQQSRLEVLIDRAAEAISVIARKKWEREAYKDLLVELLLEPSVALMLTPALA